MEHSDGTRPRAFLDTATAVPAFLRVNDYRLLFLLGVGHHNVGGANVHAQIAADADIRVKLDRLVGRGGIRYHVGFLAHIYLPSLLV